MSARSAYLEWTPVPRIAIALPLPLPWPDGFAPADPATWPAVHGRLEYVHGRLLYMPPCGDEQQDTAADAVFELGSWCRQHDGFVVAGNEAGMMLGPDVRGADAAVWRSVDAGPYSGGFRRLPPLLAVEVAGKDEEAAELLGKAEWYLEHGVEVVWVLDPRTATVLVKTRAGLHRAGPGEAVPPHPSLPGLGPRVDDLFRQRRRR
jgi:Uma2 family endonuclease